MTKRITVCLIIICMAIIGSAFGDNHVFNHRYKYVITDNKLIEYCEHNKIEIDNIFKHHIITHVDLTCYQPLAEQCWGDPLTTADMSRIDLDKLKRGTIKWCAISRDLLWLFPMGSKIDIEGFGIYEIHDVMNKRFDHRVDILIHPSDKTRFHGKKIKVTKYGE